jgi:AcrR family transcriptional regulator
MLLQMNDTGNTTAATPSRGQRRKLRTRSRLLRAAYALMAERGVAGVSIQEITEAADVGFGSFYNHFPSKEAIHEAVVQEVLVRFSEALQQISETIEDPAEVVAASTRYVALRAREEPTWGRFLVRSAFSAHNVAEGMGRFLLEDLRRGLDSGRFRSDDPFLSLVMIAGTVAASIHLELERSAAPEMAASMARALGGSVDGLAERAASAVLRQLGVPRDEAEAIANRPLPHVSLPTDSL